MKTQSKIFILLSSIPFIRLAGCAANKQYLFNGKDFTGWKLFIPDKNIDPNTVWMVANSTIHCAGQPVGYLRTKKEFSNYKLHLEWRWPKNPTNSGVLLHATGPDLLWPTSVEAQLQTGNAGDIYLIGQGVSLTVDGKKYIVQQDPPFLGIPKKQPSSENPPGQWNTYDIICKNENIELYVNSVLQNKGTNASLTSGSICLQSEGSPIEFRNIYIERLD